MPEIITIIILVIAYIAARMVRERNSNMFDMDEKFRQQRAQEKANQSYDRATEQERRLQRLERLERLEDERAASSFVWKIIRILIVVFFIYVAYSWWNDPANQSKGIRALQSVVRPTITVANERIQLGEGRAKYYPFDLASTSRVRVQVNAGPRDVNVMLMNGGQLEAFQQSAARNPILGPLGNEYSYTSSPLDGLNVLTMDQSAFLPPGAWGVVVLRPREAIPPFGQESAAQVVVTVN